MTYSKYFLFLKLTRCLSVFLFFLVGGLLLTTPGCKGERKVNEPPNIVLIMGDDIGYSDIGAYGSEIKTPHLDRLATQGLRFRTFYNNAKCETTRSSLLTGYYRGNEQTISLAEWLKKAGYHTIMVGKEHFTGWVPDHCYAKISFDTSFYFPLINEFHIPPDSTFQRPFFLHGEKLEVSEILVKNPPFFKTEVLTDYALRFLDARDPHRPFFLYLPYHAAHYPLQAPENEIDQYLEVYEAGWDLIRKNRIKKMKAMGLIPQSTQIPPPSDNINAFRGHPKGDEEIREKIPLYRPWEDLTSGEKEKLAREMAVFAAMIDVMDQNIGRVIDWLEKHNELEKTLIMYLSDNGSCPYDSNRDFDVPPGPANSYRTLSAAWASVGNTPFRYFKQFGHEGGGRTQFIVHWPGVVEANTLTDQPGHMVDMVPTLLDIVDYPQEKIAETTMPFHGSSLLPVFKGEERAPPEFIMSGFSERFRMFRRHDWKIVKVNDGGWELYNLQNDPTELQNLAQTQPDTMTRLVEAYTEVQDRLQQQTGGTF